MTPAFHLISFQGELQQVTHLDHEAQTARERGCTIKPSITLDEMIDSIGGFGQIPKFMSDQTWAEVAGPGMRDADRPDNAPQALFGGTPIDLPLPVALGRIDFITAYGKWEDLPTAAELTEILMAAQHSRAINEALFQEGSKTCTPFAAAYDEPVDEQCELLQQLEEAMGEMRSELASETAMFGDGGPGSRIRIALVEQLARELDYIIAGHPDSPHANPGPS